MSKFCAQERWRSRPLPRIVVTGSTPRPFARAQHRTAQGRHSVHGCRVKQALQSNAKHCKAMNQKVMATFKAARGLQPAMSQNKVLASATVKRRRVEAEFTARGLKSRDDAEVSGDDVDANVVLARLRRKLDAARVSLEGRSIAVPGVTLSAVPNRPRLSRSWSLDTSKLAPQAAAKDRNLSFLGSRHRVTGFGPSQITVIAW